MTQPRRRQTGRKASAASGARTASPSSPPADLSAVAGNVNAALMAVSTTASPDDAKKDTIFACIVSNFAAQGLNHIQNQQARVVWTTIDDPIIVALGDGITNCIIARGFECTPLAPAFLNLKNMGQVTVVGDLVNGIAMVVRP
jgi:hypothetical protein